LAGGALAFGDRGVMAGIAGKIRVGESNTLEGRAAQDLALRRWPSLPKKKPGCGLQYACPQRFRTMPAMSLRASNPEEANISISCSRTRCS
jgi:hypothetical protein